jgi:hypothetical protein
MTMGRYIKKPVEIEAWHWTPPEFKEHMPDWLLDALDSGEIERTDLHKSAAEMQLRIKTLEGRMNASPGDWIIRGVKNEIYPCKPDIFEATYRPAAIIAMGPELLTPEMEEMLNKQPGGITWISDVQEVDPKTHPRGEPVIRDDIIQRADKLFNMGALLLCERISELERQLQAEGEHTAAAQAKIEELEGILAGYNKNLPQIDELASQLAAARREIATLMERRE